MNFKIEAPDNKQVTNQDSRKINSTLQKSENKFIPFHFQETQKHGIYYLRKRQLGQKTFTEDVNSEDVVVSCLSCSTLRV